MKRDTVLAFEFVKSIPEKLVDGTLYVSMDYATVAHKCCCGCGSEVVTPLSPTDWKLTYDGQSISLWPSVGNWSFDCQSHYWIVKNRVNWAKKWSAEEIEFGRASDRWAKQDYYSGDQRMGREMTNPVKSNSGFWTTLLKRLLR